MQSPVRRVEVLGHVVRPELLERAKRSVGVVGTSHRGLALLAGFVTTDVRLGDLTRGDELKLVYPQRGVQPREVEALRFTHFYLQPRDNSAENTHACLDYIREHPQWRLSVQTHKYIGVR